MERLFGLDAQLLFELCLTGLAVFCLFMALSFILFNPVRDMLKKRQQMVQETKDTANKEKEDALALKAGYEEKLKKVIAEKCVHCVNYSKDTCEEDFKSHIEHIDLNGECWSYEKKN